MRIALLTATCILLLTAPSLAQKKKLPLQPDKYRINLPDYWKKGHRVWTTLHEKLPLVCEELVGKDVCGDDCNPRYTVEMYITEPGDYQYWCYPTSSPVSTRITAPAMRINDPRPVPQQPVVREPVQRNTWTITTYYNFQCFLVLVDNEGKILSKMVLVDTNETWQKTERTNLVPKGWSQPQAPATYIEENKDTIHPGLRDLFAIIEEKILAL